MRKLIFLLLCILLLATSTPEPTLHSHPRPTKDYALFIAVNNYQNPKLLDFANPQGNPKKDAQEIEQLLKDQYAFSTERLNDPTAAEITAKLEQYERDFRSGTKDPNGQLFLFFSGHGEREYGNGFFLAADADPTKLYEKSIPYALWRPRIANFNCKHIMVVIDACYSGTFDPNWFNRPKSYGTRAGELDATAKLQANYDAKKTRMFFTSATEAQSPEVSSFAKKLKEGLLSGGGTDGILTSTELFSSLELSSPRPYRGEFEQDEAGSTYLFFQQEKPTNFDLQSYEQTQRDIQAWKTAQTTNIPSAYLDYLQKFPQGTFREEASKALATAEEGQHWELARLRNTPTAYQAYLSRYPNGRYAVEAKKNLQPTTASDRDGIPENILPLVIELEEKSSISCFGAKSGAILAKVQGGKAPYRFQWSDLNTRDEAAIGLPAGNYSLTVTDATGAQKTAQLSLSQPEAMSLSLSKKYGVTAETAKDGLATVQVKGGTGPLKYVWSTGETLPAAQQLCMGINTVTVTDANGCTATLGVDINKKNIPELTAGRIRNGQAIRVEQLQFDIDSINIKASFIPILDEVFEFLTDNPGITVEVGGHTNGLCQDEFCIRLSTDRAKSVAEYLINKGIDTNRVLFKGYGRTIPIATNSTPEGRQKNQRVEIKIIRMNG